MPEPRALSSRTAITGSIPSQKPTRHMVHYRGLLQRAYIYLLEYDSLVQSYETRPFSLAYRSHHRLAHYTPDFRVFWKHQRPRLVACLSQAAANRPATAASLTAAQLWCQQADYDFAIVTEAILAPHRVLLSNLELLAVHAFTPIPAQTRDYLLKIIAQREGPFSSVELVEHTPLLDPGQTKSYLWKLVAQGELLTDLTQPLHPATTALRWSGHLASAHPKPVCPGEPFSATRASVPT